MSTDMAEWTITAKTIYCDAVEDEVTLLVNGDGTWNCTSYDKYGSPDKATARLLKNRGRQSGRKLACTGPECHRLIAYRDELLDERDMAGKK